MKGKSIAYWVTTVILVSLILSGGIMQVMRRPDAVDGIVRLAMGSAIGNVIGPLVFTGLLVASWALRPDTRRI